MTLNRNENPGNVQEQSKEVVGAFVVERVVELQTKYGILAQHFFSEVGNGNLASDLAVAEFLNYEVKPLQNEIDSWLDW